MGKISLNLTRYKNKLTNEIEASRFPDNSNL